MAIIAKLTKCVSPEVFFFYHSSDMFVQYVKVYDNHPWAICGGLNGVDTIEIFGNFFMFLLCLQTYIIKLLLYGFLQLKLKIVRATCHLDKLRVVGAWFLKLPQNYYIE